MSSTTFLRSWAAALASGICATSLLAQQYQPLEGLPELRDLIVWDHATADVDGDGDLDVVLGGQESLTLLRNQGGLRFARVAIPNNTDWVYGLALFDADRDGDQDLYVARGGYDSFYLNDGAGGFTLAPGRFPQVFDSSRAALPLDVDRDGDLDLLVANVITGWYVDGNRLFINDGTGRFSDASSRLPYSPSSVAIEAGDIDGDGDLDVVFGNDGTDTLLRNDGTGNFQAVTPVPWDSIKTVGIALRDFDGDRDLDLFAAMEVNSTLRLFLNDGLGNYVDGGSSRLPQSANRNLQFDVGDIDRDGDLDLVLGQGPFGGSVLLNSGTGTFTDATSQWLQPGNGSSSVDLLLRDLDADGDLDLWQSSAFPSPTHLLLANLSGRRFIDSLRRVLPGFDATNVAEAVGHDFDGNARPDLFVAGANALFLQRADGTFVDGSRTNVPPLPASAAVIAGDVDRDGDLDLVLGGGIRSPDHLLLNDGAGRFTDVTATHLPVATASAYDVCLVDTDRDGDLDLVCAMNLARQTRHYRNDGTGRFTDVTATTLPARLANVQAVVAGDLDGDGDADLLVATRANPPEPVRFYRNDGTGTFSDSGPLANSSYYAHDAELTDIDRDGDLDLLVAHADGLGLHRNDGGVFTDVSASQLPPIGVAYRVDVGDIDADGDIDAMCGNLLVNDGRGFFTDQTVRLARVPSAGQFSLCDLDSDGDADLLAGTELLVNLWHHAYIAEPATVGGSLRLQLFAEPGVATSPVPIVPFLATRQLTTPLDLPGLGRLWLDPTVTIALPLVTAAPPRGRVELTLPVPSAAGLAGLTLSVQSAVAHGAWRISNCSSVTLLR